MKKIILISLATILSACSNFSNQTVSGTYQGALPCADCEKIEAKLILNRDNTYQYNTVYFKNKEQHPFIEKGTFLWDKNQKNVIRLTQSGNLTFKISDNFIEFYDMESKTTQPNYKLNKVSQ